MLTIIAAIVGCILSVTLLFWLIVTIEARMPQDNPEWTGEE